MTGTMVATKDPSYTWSGPMMSATPTPEDLQVTFRTYCTPSESHRGLFSAVSVTPRS